MLFFIVGRKSKVSFALFYIIFLIDSNCLEKGSKMPAGIFGTSSLSCYVMYVK